MDEGKQKSSQSFIHWNTHLAQDCGISDAFASGLKILGHIIYMELVEFSKSRSTEWLDARGQLDTEPSVHLCRLLLSYHWGCPLAFNTLRPRQTGRHFADDIFKCIFLNENVWIPIKISLKFVPKGPINNNPALVQIMAWRRPGDKPLSEPMMVSLLTHICVTRPQCVNLISLEMQNIIIEMPLHWFYQYPLPLSIVND